MRVLIVENEIYLAQSIAAKLCDFGFECDTVSLVNDALCKDEYDVILLSTSLMGQNIYPIIEQHKDNIIILMIPYVSDDTVTKPLKAGAKDYILKPFMFDELVRKIEHYHTFQHLKQLVTFYRNYVDMVLSDFRTPNDSKVTLPIIIRSQNQKSADAFIISYARQEKISLSFFSLKSHQGWREYLGHLRQKNTDLMYVIGLEDLKKPERKEFFEIIENKRIISSFIALEEIEFKNVLDVEGVDNIDFCGKILCVDDYIRNIILRYEHKYPDTELSRRLGMSRKSLWEKRKKYGIIKKKQDPIY
ncbi:hypothetical protein CCZ01_05565 [Helicobacter monodelphidis]|uniref:response regulator n=1 Tax=Helicobacter sp. 15-1451 TaxID=2004995 RepID=UPI000DCBBEB6|nr:response regulator [Helicobacter sp. 15-1451]RAX57609.1 hypothetical protein CCZ01_05565 [Helicobacter sp. 15-1451]